MSVRLGIAKVAAIVAGTALVGGGAVHVAEKVASSHPQYVKHAKAHPAATHTEVRVHHTVKTVTHTTTCCQQPEGQPGVVPMPIPGVPTAPYTAADVPPAPDGGVQVPEGAPGVVYGPYGMPPVPPGPHGRPHPRPPVPPAPPPTPVPAPPMLLLFGGAAAALVARRRKAAQTA